MASDSKLVGKMNTPFDYSLRVSSRVKHPKLRIKPFGGLEVIIPPRFPKRAVPELLNHHTQWIETQLQKYQSAEPALPDNIQLAFDESHWPIVYEHRLTTNSPNQIVINSNNDDTDKQADRVWQLRNWIRQKAWRLLPPLLEQLSQQTGLTYKKISIRSQKTRWGSCSSSGTISVNDQLLFLPRDTAGYLMIHELCHTHHMNHSSRFWHLVESHCADYRDHEHLLNQARTKIPDWFLRDLYR
ncbi:MAG: putative metal-dependent hydrolase [Candidatus Azotimanducaceae bacterium]|jgi:predicted metal-dependent hydrolase